MHSFCLAPLIQGNEGTVEVSPAGININKKQMDLCGGQLSINQTQGHLRQTWPRLAEERLFSWLPSGQTATPSPPPLPFSRWP